MRWGGLLLCVACADPVRVPDEPPALYGALGGFDVCGNADGSSTLEVVSIDHRGDGELWLTEVRGPDCDEVPVLTLAPGTFELEAFTGSVWGVRDPDTLYLHAHFRVTVDGPFQVVVP